jgi:hypothetical protein
MPFPRHPNCCSGRAFKYVAAVALFLLLTAMSFAQTTATTTTSHTFNNELFAGGVFSRAASGPNSGDMNFGGWNLSATHYLTPRVGATVDIQGLYGNAPVPASLASSDLLVSKYLFMAGPQLRLHQSARLSGSLRLLAGVADSSAATPAAVPAAALGLYPNATKLAFKPGGTFDINLSSRWAIRNSAGVLLERQNAGFQRGFDLSTGIVFRFGL